MTIRKVDIKECTKCGTTKQLEEFKLQKRKTGHFPTSWCRACLNEKSKLWMRNHLKDPTVRERAREKDKNRYERLKDDPGFRAKERERAKEYCARPEVKERNAERAKEWSHANPERVLARARQWRENHPGAQTESSRAHHLKRRDDVDYKLRRIVAQGERRWRMYNQGEGLFTSQQARLAFAFWGDKCAYCGENVTVGKQANHSGFDHVVPLLQGGGHGPSNMVVCCRTCNTRKNKYILPELILENLSGQLDVFVSLLPPEATWNKWSAVPLVVRRAVILAEEKLRGLGHSVGTPWAVQESS